MSAQVDDLIKKWKKCTAREKAVVITAFLNEYGENATWEEWLAFLQKHDQIKRFKWTLSVD